MAGMEWVGGVVGRGGTMMTEREREREKIYKLEVAEFFQKP